MCLFRVNSSCFTQRRVVLYNYIPQSPCGRNIKIKAILKIINDWLSDLYDYTSISGPSPALNVLSVRFSADSIVAPSTSTYLQTRCMAKIASIVAAANCRWTQHRNIISRAGLELRML